MNHENRKALVARLFPSGIPKLWCPTITHFKAAGVFDEARIENHLEKLAPFVKGILVPGSTGEGWEMSDADVRRLLEIVLPIANTLGIHVLVGLLKTDTQSMLSALDALAPLLANQAVVGVTICPPKGKQLTQEQLREAVSQVLERGVPTAVYQLPQVTENELAPETVAELANQYANFILFKDTSGQDRVANSGVDLQGIWMLRGSESGGYASWLRAAGGHYDGFLLSTANVFAVELSKIISLVEAGQQTRAAALSDHLVQIVSTAFALVASYPHGNAFTNANKLLDHLRSYGKAYRSVAPPVLISGATLAMELADELERHFPDLLRDVNLPGEAKEPLTPDPPPTPLPEAGRGESR